MTCRIVLIGGGAIARRVINVLHERGIVIDAVLVRPGTVEDRKAFIPTEVRVIESISVLGEKPELVAECAGHRAVAEFGPSILSAGIDLVVMSSGALADEVLFKELSRSAKGSSAKLIIPAGAAPGVDAIAAANLGGLDEVTYTIRKPPSAWLGTYAESKVKLATIKSATEIFRGDARSAARTFPSNANVCATVALAGIGFLRTEVVLVADPRTQGNVGEIAVRGNFGEMNLVMRGRPLPENAKTSMLAALSLARTLINRNEQICI